ncbi:glycerophosphodiester phosphodiesterase [Lacticaseibacillus parakribbianus]|uniref:glycerophosphodiester phosphodiesterase n=1 Tax=Lacticaseibacillus parakribbianus TaxID=2970927 RepID=UPI0021CB6837|nr:glycerophosphodiester phosphodiesterase [Lacticaseibacillus parakribbianus]
MRNAILLSLIGIYLCCTAFTVVGHRGDPTKAPEETLQSDDLALASGADAVELDVQESADGVLVVQHDPTIMRMTGADLAIATTPFATLHAYHTKNGEPVHSLDEVLTHYQHRPGRLLIETKIEPGIPHPHLEAKIAAALARTHMTDRVMFHSFSKKSLKRLQKLLPQVPRLLIVGSLHRITFAVFKYASGIDVAADLVTPDMVKSLHAMHQLVYVWDEMNETTAKWRWLANLNLDGVVTNYPQVASTYARLRRKASRRSVDARLINTTTAALPIYENPYTQAATGHTLASGQGFATKAEVRSNGVWYAQLSQNRYVPTAGLTKAPAAGWATALLNRRVRAMPRGLRLWLHNGPSVASGRSGFLSRNASAKILAVVRRHGHTWVQLTAGWVRLQRLGMAQALVPRPLNCGALPEAPQRLWFHGPLLDTALWSTAP